MNDFRKVYDAGDVVICLNNHEIGTLATDLYTGDHIRADTFNFREGQERVDGEMAVCAECGVGWMRGFGDWFAVRK